MQYLTEAEVSRITGIAKQTLRNWRTLGRGLPYLKVGRLVRYLPEDVRSFMERYRIDPEGKSDEVVK